ncbi:3-oxoacyl-[acyl-carrier protein] reductase [Ottowia thiooxydans]|uniref:3-oxoacyl-[acyl-carrier protein] reductase n=1 Tax=Ottowia thiooxydans TaxID=219182 RepID=A0ABV2Q5B1_9BURK
MSFCRFVVEPVGKQLREIVLAVQDTAIVTGAARGMGLEIARKLGSLGHHVVIVDALKDELNAASEALQSEGLSVQAIHLDLADDTQIAALPQRIGDRFERVAILVNNAGISPSRNGKKVPAPEIELSEWEHVLKVNLTAPFRMMQVCLPPMRERKWGRIVNISSRAGRSPGGAAGSAYVTSKSGLLGLTRAFAKELGPEGITVNAVAPGRIETPMGASSPPDVLAQVLQNIPVGRFGEPSEVAAMVAYLASPEAGFVTGATFDINGGILMI